MSSILIGLIGSTLISWIAYRRNSLTRDGALAAVAVGTILYAAGDFSWFGTMILFFITSSILTKWKSRQKEKLESGYAKSGNRDAVQVLANGGTAALLCVLHAFFPNFGWWIAFMGVMAAATADTWATEVGGLSRSKPRSVITWRQVEPGQSGGVTPAGTIASAAGALLIGSFAVISAGLLKQEMQMSETLSKSLLTLLIITASGTFGGLADSFIGAAAQRMNRCVVCGREIEAGMHCNAVAVKSRGISWMNNDVVNVIATWVGGGTAFILAKLLL
ncbi:DUF92 domain-containing protein [Paenibacillus turpanensis]|uniref:DUF92 domain-containing protein n=1 Tax=Paenibacillus turpanensis TaxID=2689078 RepID=UPI001408CA18|nr:DUF92 domain-containing protein [Paenibacillus turpanensis]